jgi:hypothetical protein
MSTIITIPRVRRRLGAKASASSSAEKTRIPVARRDGRGEEARGEEFPLLKWSGEEASMLPTIDGDDDGDGRPSRFSRNSGNSTNFKNSTMRCMPRRFEATMSGGTLNIQPNHQQQQIQQQQQQFQEQQQRLQPSLQVDQSMAKSLMLCAAHDCSESFATEARMRRHMREVHHGGRYRCPQFETCGRDYSNSSALGAAPVCRAWRRANSVSCYSLWSNFSLGRVAHAPRHALSSRACRASSFSPSAALATARRACRCLARSLRSARISLPRCLSAPARSFATISPRSTAPPGPTARSIAPNSSASTCSRRPMSFKCPWPECEHVAAYRFELCNHYVRTHRTALGDGDICAQGGRARRCH